MDIQNSKDLVKLLQGKRIWIYGTGYVANNFYEIIRLLKLDANLKGFIVSQKAQESFCGHPVKSISEVGRCRDEVICIAVHESIKGEIVLALENLGLDNYIWIYPFLWELKLGVVEKESAEISVAKIVKASVKDYKLVIRYLAIEQYFGKNDFGYDFYINALSAFGKRETAEKRLESFWALIGDWERNGYNAEYPVITNANYELIDGHHRVALAKYHGMEKIRCDVYCTTDNVELGNGALTRKILANAGFDEDEIGLLDKYRENVLLKE